MRMHDKTRLMLSSALVSLAMVSTTISADTSRSVRWPSGWLSPLSSRVVDITAEWGALSLGCGNASTDNAYEYYDDSGTTGHLGMDLRAKAYTPVQAIGDGQILAVRYWSGAGYAIHVVHRTRPGDEFTVVYGHIDVGENPRTGTSWNEGDIVLGGETIGEVTANSKYPPHLHFGLAKGRESLIHGTSQSKVRSNGNCRLVKENTTDPIGYLKSRKGRHRAELVGGIVGWKNADGSVVSWLVEKGSDGELSRYWVSDTDTYWNCRDQGSDDWGPQSSVFLDQLPDQWGESANCQ